MNWCKTSSIGMIHWESRVQLLHCEFSVNWKTKKLSTTAMLTKPCQRVFYLRDVRSWSTFPSQDELVKSTGNAPDETWLLTNVTWFTQGRVAESFPIPPARHMAGVGRIIIVVWCPNMNGDIVNTFGWFPRTSCIWVILGLIWCKSVWIRMVRWNKWKKNSDFAPRVRFLFLEPGTSLQTCLYSRMIHDSKGNQSKST